MFIDQQNGCLDFWESKATLSPSRKMTKNEYTALESTYINSYNGYLNNPFLSFELLKKQQFERVKYLVYLAYTKIPLYRKKYQKVGFEPGDLHNWDDFSQLPIVTKREMIDAYPKSCVNPEYSDKELFDTRSSGSSGEVLRIKVNLDAIVIDTIQGARQFYLQSNGKYTVQHLTAFVYTLPWWFRSIGNKFKTAFISSLIPPSDISNTLKTLKPNVLSLYPTNLQSLLEYVADNEKESLFLIVTHSEQSSKLQRKAWSEKLKVPVLDEYSSEEATRIALELPCGHYHVCEDTVVVEVLDSANLSKKVDGKPGMAVITNLLNEAMPFIRYYSGDYVTIPHTPSKCHIKWSQLQSIDGRQNDSFISKKLLIVPAGTILDVTYRWMNQGNLNCSEFELIQKESEVILARFVPEDPTNKKLIEKSLKVLTRLLSECMQHPVKVISEVVESLPQSIGKRRPIRSELIH